jgi:hypothetical protein
LEKYFPNKHIELHKNNTNICFPELVDMSEKIGPSEIMKLIRTRYLWTEPKTTEQEDLRFEQNYFFKLKFNLFSFKCWLAELWLAKVDQVPDVYWKVR